MPIPSEIAGAVFDVDETLLDTNVIDPVNGLHERARLQATHETGRRYNMSSLIDITPEENHRLFLDAPLHTMESIVWHTLYMRGLELTPIIDPTNKIFQEIIARKDELFEHLLRTEGKPIVGAVEFVECLAVNGLRDHLAIASMGIRRDIDIFLQTSGLDKFFPSARIVSKGDVQHPKPHPEAFDAAFKRLHLDESYRSQVLAFEDNPRGIVAAKAAGLYTCAITTVHTREQLANQPIAPDLIAGSFAEFEQLLSLR